MMAHGTGKEESATEKSWRVQYAAIPWENSGEGTLTVNLAIWALAMMNLNEGHRPIRILDHTLPLNVWWIDQGESLLFEHHLSSRVVTLSDRQDGMDARPRPDTIPTDKDIGCSRRAKKKTKAPLTSLQFLRV